MLRSTDQTRATSPVQIAELDFWSCRRLIAIVLVTLAIIQPNMSRWISESVQAEFVGGGNIDDAPTQVARPDTATPERTVLAD